MATAQKKAQPATHFTVWVGLGLSVIGLLIAMYAYSGTRVYDIAYAYVAIAGGVVALGGILVSAWGRAIMSARAQRIRRQTIQQDALKLADAGLAEAATPPPTLAEPPQKKRFAFSLPSLPARKGKAPAAVVEGGASSGTLFAFRSRAPPPPAPEEAPAPPEIPAVEGLVETPLAVEAPPAEPPAPERVTLRCPSCATQFAAEGVRPLAVTCPSCGFSATV